MKDKYDKAIRSIGGKSMLRVIKVEFRVKKKNLLLTWPP
jgi:hypothetical protein